MIDSARWRQDRDRVSLILFTSGAEVARYKLPHHCTTLTMLPRTGSGKIKKPELRALLIANEGAASALAD